MTLKIAKNHFGAAVTTRHRVSSKANVAYYNRLVRTISASGDVSQSLSVEDPVLILVSISQRPKERESTL